MCLFLFLSIVAKYVLWFYRHTYPPSRIMTPEILVFPVQGLAVLTWVPSGPGGPMHRQPHGFLPRALLPPTSQRPRTSPLPMLDAPPLVPKGLAFVLLNPQRTGQRRPSAPSALLSTPVFLPQKHFLPGFTKQVILRIS